MISCVPTYWLVKPSESKRPSGEVHFTGNFSPLGRLPSEGFIDRPKSATFIMMKDIDETCNSTADAVEDEYKVVLHK